MFFSFSQSDFNLVFAPNGALCLGSSSNYQGVDTPLTFQAGTWRDVFETTSKVSESLDSVSKLVSMFEEFKNAIKYVHSDGGSGANSFTEDLMSRLEDLFYLSVGVVTSSSMSNAVSLIMLYSRSFTPKPFYGSLLRLLRRVFSDVNLDQQSGSEARAILENFMSNPLRRGIGSILSILLVVGLIPEQTQSMTAFHLYDLFGVRVTRKTCGATTFVELLTEVVKFTFDHAIPAVVSGDHTLLWSDKELNTLDDEYNVVASAFDLLQTGNISQISMLEGIESDQDYLDKLHSVRERMMFVRNSTTNAHLKQVLNSKLYMLQKRECDLYMAWKSAPIRVKPFGICFSGSSGVNKTTAYEITNRAICSVNGFPCNHNTNCTLNGDDKYQSEMDPRKITVLFDDVANTKLEWMKNEDPCRKFLQFLNNAHCNALNAQVEKKGVMAINCKLVYVTTNRPDLGAYVFSCEPASILRRFELHVTMSIKPECIDPATGMAYAHMLNSSLPDCWKFEVYQPRIVRTAKGVPDKLDMVLLLETGSIVEYLDLVKTLSVEHFALQNRMVQRATEREKEPWCQEHHFPACSCPRCPIVKQECGHSSDDFVDGHCLICSLDRWADKPTISVDEFLGKFEDAVEQQTGDCDFDGIPRHRKRWCEEKCIDWRQHVHSISRVVRSNREQVLKGVLGLASLGAAYAAYKLLVSIFDFSNPIVPQDRPFVQTPLGDEAFEKPVMWKRADYVREERPLASRTSTPQQLEELVYRNLAFVRYWREAEPNVVKVCNAMAYKGNAWIIPSHVFSSETPILLEFRVPQARTDDRVFRIKLRSVDVYFVPNSDICLAVVVSSGSMSDMSRFVPSEKNYANLCPHLCGYYNERGDREKFYGSNQGVQKVRVEGKEYDALTYNLTQGVVTKPGLCGMVVCEAGKKPMIVGFHTAGRTGTSYGVASRFVKEDLDLGVEKLFRQGLLEQSSGPLRTEMYGKTIQYDCPIPIKSPVRYLPAEFDRNYELLGSHEKGTPKFTSNMRVFEFSAKLADNLDLPRKHCPPQTRQQWKSPQRVLDKLSRTRIPLDPQIVELAYNDLIASSSPYFARSGRLEPLDYCTAINGIDGVRGLDRMDCNTSAGYPLNKPKGSLMYELAPDDKRTVVRDFDVNKADVLAECEIKKECIRRGERPNFIFQSVLKDEGVTFKKFDESKNRVFQCCEVAAVVLFRQYFLPLLRVEQRYGKELESGVGINASSPEFGELFEHLAEFSVERCFAGDYAGFDTSMPFEITRCTYAYYLHFAEKAGYSQDDLLIMRGLCCEAMYPLVEYFGAWVYLHGLTPSGIPLTVHKNNNDNRLLMRYAYYSMNREAALFGSNVRLVCYGDDNVVAVKENVQFNHNLVSRELAKIGVEYTSADKSSEFPDYVTIMELEFLKRQFRNDPELGVVGFLSVDSISKSLHLYRVNKKCLLTRAQLAAQAFDGALREWFLYGRGEFDRRRGQLLRLAEIEVDGESIIRFMRAPTFDELKDSYFAYKLWDQSGVELAEERMLPFWLHIFMKVFFPILCYLFATVACSLDWDYFLLRKHSLREVFVWSVVRVVCGFTFSDFMFVCSQFLKVSLFVHGSRLLWRALEGEFPRTVWRPNMLLCRLPRRRRRKTPKIHCRLAPSVS